MPSREFLRARRDERQLFAGREAVGGPDGQSGLVAALEPGDPHHVELVEIGREDREELGALEQRQRRVLGQCEHPGIEVEPAQFAVEVAIVGQSVVAVRLQLRSRWRRVGRWWRWPRVPAVGWCRRRHLLGSGTRVRCRRSARGCRRWSPSPLCQEPVRCETRRREVGYGTGSAEPIRSSNAAVAAPTPRRTAAPRSSIGVDVESQSGPVRRRRRGHRHRGAGARNPDRTGGPADAAHVQWRSAVVPVPVWSTTIMVPVARAASSASASSCGRKAGRSACSATRSTPGESSRACSAAARSAALSESCRS